MKKILSLASIICAFLILSSSSCHWGCAGEQSLYLKNASSDILACYIAHGYNCNSYPDTLLPTILPASGLTEHIKDSIRIWRIRGYDYSDFYYFTQSKVLSVYIINQGELDYLGWEELSNRNQYLVRYDLTEKDLISLRGKLYYPPSEAMRNVKMWPRYEDVRP